MRHIIRYFALAFGLLSLSLLVKASLPQVTTGTWSSGGTMASAHDAGCSVLLQDGRLMVIGGSDAHGPTANVDIFNTDGTWSSAAVMQSPRASQACAVLQNGQVLAAGGDAGAGAVNTAELYDPSANSWSSLPVMTQARSGATASLLQDGRVLLAGGGSNALEIFDPNSQAFSFVGTMSAARQDAAAAVMQDGRVLIVGGSGIDSATGNPTVLASSDIYDPNAGAVSAGPALSVARSLHSATTQLDGKVAVIGGSNGSADLNSIEIFDPVAGNFSSASASLATPRSGHLAFLLPKNNEILVVGGQSAGADLASAELYAPWGGVSGTGAMKAARSQASGSSLSVVDGLLMVAGGSSQNTAELYTFATVKTDASDYAPGTMVTITGTGWQPGETVALTFVESPLIDTHPILYATADVNGNISNSQFSPDVHDVAVRFYLTATGSKSQAQNTFTDALATTTTIASSSNLNTSLVGGSVTFTAGVTQAGSTVTSGTVTFTIGGNNNCGGGTVISSNVSLASGQASASTTFASSGSFTIRACYSGFGNGSTALQSSNASLTQIVNKITPVITWGNPLTITYGTALSSTQLNATASALGTSVSGTFAYNPSAGTVLNAGSGQTLSVIFTPSDTNTYTSAAASVTINVNQASTITTLGSWSQLAPTGTGPAQGLFGMSIVEDSSGNLIMFGGSTGSPTNDVWVLSGGNGLGGTPVWTKLSPAGSPPAPRFNHAAVYDSATNSMIIYGGCEGGCFPIGNDAWVLSHANGIGGTPTWSLLTFSGPSSGGRQNMAKAYDPTSNQAIIFGGQNGGGSGGATFPEVWVLSHANGTGGSAVWSKLTTSGTIPPGQYGPSSFYDVTNNRLTVAGGAAQGSGVPTNAVYVLTHANGLGGTPTWTNLVAEGAAGSPAGFGSYPAAYDATNNQGILVESGGTNNLWLLSNGNGLGGTTAYSHLMPSGGVSAVVGLQGAAYDPVNSRVSSLYQNAGSNQLFVLGAGSPDASAFGQSVTFTARVSAASGNPTGTVTFKDGATTLGTGTLSTTSGATTATFTTSGLSFGTHTITAVYGADGNFTASTSSWALTQTVNQATPTVTWSNPADIIYGTALSGTQLNATASVPGTFTYTPAAGTVLNVGSGQTLSVHFVPNDTTDYSIPSDKTVLINVTKAAATVTLGSLSQTYSGSPEAATATTTPSGLTVSFTYNGLSTAPTNAGSYTAVGTISDPTYQGSATGTLVISKATPTITWSNPFDITYGTALSGTQLNATASVSGTFAYSPAAGTVLKAGSGQALSVTFTPTDATDYSSASKSVAINVIALTTTCSITAANKTYDGTTAATVSNYSLSGVLGTDIVNCSASGTVTFADKKVGTGKTVTATGLKLGGKDAGNYVLSSTSATATANITQLAITVTAVSDTKQYDGTTHSVGSPTIAPAIATGDTASFVQTFADKNVGTGKTLTPSGVVADGNSGGNYAVTFASVATGSITQRPITVTADAKTKVYGDADPAFTYSITSGSLVAGDSLSGNLTRASGDSVGSYAIQQGTLTAGSNYALTYVGANLTITARSITVTADAQTKVYGSSDPALTYKTSGALVGSDSFSGSLTRVAGLDAGTYAIQQGTLMLSTNYTLNYVGANLTITQATPTISAVVLSCTYNGSPCGGSGSATGVLNPPDSLLPVALSYSGTQSDGTAYGPSASAPVNAGAYTLIVAFAGNTDYTPASGQANFSIAQVQPSIVWANPADIAYGTALSGTQLNATLSTPIPGSFSYNPPLGTVLPVGSTEALVVLFTPTDTVNYTTANANVAINVTKAAPRVIWSNPADIRYPTALGSTQLDAIAPAMPVGVIGWWKADENTGTTAQNAVGADTATLTNGASWAAGKYNSAFSLSAAQTQYVDAGNTPNLQVSHGDFSVAAWVYFNSLSGDMSIVDKMGNGPNDDGWRLIKQTDDRFWFCIGQTPGDNTCYPGSMADSTTVATTGQWYFLVATKTSTTASIFVNGNFESSGSVGPIHDTDAVNLHFGSNVTQGAYLDGMVDEPMLFNHALSNAEVQALYGTQAGAFAYTPDTGTVLNAGSGQALKTGFTPTDTANFTTATASVSINVLKANQTISFGTLGDKTYGDSAFPVSATGGASNNPVTFATSSTACSVSATGTVTIVSAGPCSITASQAGNDNYNDATPVTQPFTINRADAKINVVPYNVTYDGSSHTATGTATGVGGVDLSSGLKLSASTHTDAGDYQDGWSFFDVTGNYNADGGVIADHITKANAKITVTSYSVTYDGNPHTATGSATGVEIPPVDLSSLLHLDGTTHTYAGDYSTDSWSFEGNSNYNSTKGTVHDSIAKANAKITVTPYSVTYDGSAHTATGSALGVSGETLAGLDLGGTTHTGASDYPMVDPWTFTDVTGNYNNANATVSDSIARANAIISVKPYSVTYDGNAHTATGSATGVKGEALNGLNLSASNHTNAGDYQDGWSFVDATGNYNADGNVIADHIAKANANITVTLYAVTYDGAAHTATGTVTGIKGETLAGLDLSGTTHTNAADYPSDPWKFTDSTGNYNNANSTVHDSIAKADATISVSGYSGVYDANSHGATGSAKGVKGEDLSTLLNLGLSFTDVPGGTAHWTFAGDTNYNNAAGDASIVLTQAQASVTVKGYNGVYDGNAHGATGSATGIGGANLSNLLSLGSTFTDAPGGTANWSFAGNTDYQSASGTAAIVINKAGSTVTVTVANATYDGNLHGGTANVTGIGGLNQSLTVSYVGTGITVYGPTNTAPVNAGTYEADASFGGDGDHSGSNGSATFAIAKASSTTTVTVAGGASFTYDSLSHPATVSVTGVNLILAQPPVYSCGHAPISVADSGCTASYNYAGDANHNSSSDSKTYTINKALLTVTANNAAMTLDGVVPSPLTGTLTGVLGADGITATYTTAATGTAVGSFPITPVLSDPNGKLPNYSVTSKNGTLTVTYAPANAGLCDGDLSHTILQPVNADGTSTFKQGSTVPAKFRVCDAKGTSIGLSGVVTSFNLVYMNGGTLIPTVDETVDSSTPDTAFRWDSTAQQWIFNISTKGLPTHYTYTFQINLNDGSFIQFVIGLPK